jgi:leucyl-tRNA synthetase
MAGIERKEFNHKHVAEKWQKEWGEHKVFKAKDGSKKKFYLLEMFPYPSASGLHMGHALNYTIGDIFARFKVMQGYDVLHPMGFDSFGLPAENAAIKAKSHPKKFTEDAIKNYIKQMKGLGLSYDWDRMVETHKPDYYKWDQWLFLKMYEKGLAYKKKSPVNWCPDCNTVLANEQVHNGKCWRHEDTNVEIKNLDQWFFKTTAYADELYENLDKPILSQWPELIRKLQKNWIGKSHGTEIEFKINGEAWKIFTTRPDTLFGVTFVVVSAQHPRLHELVTAEQKDAVDKFIHGLHSTKQEDIDQMEKEGVFTGSYAIHPLTEEKVPVYAGNFVVADYGSGMVMAVSAPDQRDYEFAVKYKISIKQVIAPTFITTKGPDAIREDVETEKRDCVFGIVKHWKEDEYLCLSWKNNFGWKSFVSGGIEQDETPAEAVKREVIEETGYKNIKSVKSIDMVSYLSCFAHHKKINRDSKYYTFIVELGSEEHDAPKEEELVQHETVWLNKNDVSKFLNLDNNKFLWDIYLNGGSAFTDYGTLMNSDKFNGLSSEEAKEKITEELAKKGIGRKVTNFRLRDWLISRQRFWGTPIPIIYCDKCGIVPVPEKDLPVTLPEDVVFSDVKNPLTEHAPFLNTVCPKCKGPAKRETDTMDTFVNSSWYYLRYTDPKNTKEIFSKKLADEWCPVDFYIGGKEHACMHLIYIRFYTKFLRDMGMLDFNEPAIRLFNQGMLQGPDGEKMSKSKGNVVLPEVVSEKYGLDAARLFLVSVASPDKDINWSDKGVEGSVRFLNKVINYADSVKFGETGKRTKSRIHQAIKEVTKVIESLNYNIATIKIRELFDSLGEEISKEDFEMCLKLLSPICPHTAEELWERIGNKKFIAQAHWPRYDESIIDEKLEYMDKQYESLRSDIIDVLKLISVTNPREIKIIISQEWKYHFVKEFKKAFHDSKDFKTISAKILSGDMKKYGQEVMKLLPGMLKDQSKIPEIVLSAEEEKDNIDSRGEEIAKEFDCPIIVELADQTDEPKAKNAWPGKPAIVVK